MGWPEPHEFGWAYSRKQPGAPTAPPAAADISDLMGDGAFGLEAAADLPEDAQVLATRKHSQFGEPPIGLLDEDPPPTLLDSNQFSVDRKRPTHDLR